MILSIVVATSNNNVIGKNNALIWHLPSDLNYFKKLTSGHHIIMGRKTYESIGRPLPNRVNIVITRQPNFTRDGIIAVNSLDEALAKVAGNEKEVFIIGGAEIYKKSLELVKRIYLTKVHHDFEGDVFFPELEKGIWSEVSRENHQADAKNKYDYSFLVLEKVSKK